MNSKSDDEGSSGGSEHKKNARPSTRNKHENGKARKAIDRGGESGDKRRRDGRVRPRNWKGPWPQFMTAMSNVVVVQVASQLPIADSVADMIVSWAKDSRNIQKVESIVGQDGDWYYWNVQFHVKSLENFEQLFRPVAHYCVKRLSEYARRRQMKTTSTSSLVVVAKTGNNWDEYLELYNFPSSQENG